MSVTLPEVFGNYALRGLEEIALPPAIAWWPQTPAWGVVLALMAASLGWLGMRVFRSYRSNRYRREALALLARWQAAESWESLLPKLPALLRGVALRAYPRHTVAPLTGDEWLDFLDSNCRSGSRFASGTGRLLLTVSYARPGACAPGEADARALVDLCRNWIQRHEVQR